MIQRIKYQNKKDSNKIPIIYLYLLLCIHAALETPN